MSENIMFEKTERGFGYAKFKDGNGKEYSIQESSAARDNGNLIWLGLNHANPQIMARDTPQGGNGWVPYGVPDGVSFDKRMHLTQQQVAALIPILQHFAETGFLPEPEVEDE